MNLYLNIFISSTEHEPSHRNVLQDTGRLVRGRRSPPPAMRRTERERSPAQVLRPVVRMMEMWSSRKHQLLIKDQFIVFLDMFKSQQVMLLIDSENRFFSDVAETRWSQYGWQLTASLHSSSGSCPPSQSRLRAPSLSRTWVLNSTWSSV